ncbi:MULTISPECIES: DNA polymerase III subunit delta [unclassified Oceanispirochaeta]|uniref:DNA polymerase III subunit delta n=1 Tax=unclassified Oceanispirochaeta TaxID=2635722 RepID=UPI000E09DA97|nr:MULTISPECIES: DNA polymerase III subunit delta [unclassified Oceanispirochaeta]MBF9015355.1 DNA polymerase III subunit delta [Oceanispirochaeta sp. M2]NPD71813.1 DNA polymerase III subunit delta [Oceanispirochaeta sp. M1]RDG33002.1 DNA polymerase III subunit delta [Oceanispirochaeta sp. M1]
MAEKQLHMLLGPEKGQKDQYLDNLRKNLKKKYSEDPESHRFYPFENDMSQILSILRNGSLFSAHKMAIILNCEEIKKAGDIKMLAQFCKNMPDDVTLVFQSDSVSVDKRIVALIPPSEKKIFWEMFDNQKKGWIQKYFSDQGLKIEAKAINVLLEMVENNTTDMKEACQKLAFYFSIGDIIREEDIDNFVYHSKEENVFTLFEKMLLKDLSGTLEVFSKITLSGDTDLVYLLSGLMRQIRRVLKVKMAVAEGESIQTAFQMYDVRGKKNQKVTGDGLRKFGLKELEQIQRKGEVLDRQMRELKKDMQVISFQLFLTRSLRGIQ